MKNFLPVLAVVLIILVLWYLGVVWLNAAWVQDQAARAGTGPVPVGDLVRQTMSLDRPVLPAPHQVAAELWKGIAGQSVTSKRSLVWHGFLTLKTTMWGFALGIVLGVAIAIANFNFPNEKAVLAVVFYHLVIGAIVSVPYVKWRIRMHAAAQTRATP